MPLTSTTFWRVLMAFSRTGSNRLHNTKSSFHIIDLWLHALNGLHFSGNFDEWLSIIKSLKDSGGKCLLNILNSGGLGNSSSFIIMRLGVESSIEGRSKAGNELGGGHGLEGLHIMVLLSGINEVV